MPGLEGLASLGVLDLGNFLQVLTELTGMAKVDAIEALLPSRSCKVDCRRFVDWLYDRPPRSPPEVMAELNLPFVEFGLCGIDKSAKREILTGALSPAKGQSHLQLGMVAGVQLAYQGFPWKPTPEYAPDGDPNKRRYEGLMYPAWSELTELLPDGVPVSFHLNETPACKYVSKLLSGDEEMFELLRSLVEDFRACHIQINLNSHGVPPELVQPESEGVVNVRTICWKHPTTTFIVPIAKIKRSDGSVFLTEPFVQKLLEAPTPGNLCAFFDSSAGTGTEPDGVPEIPSWYTQEIVGFTGGLSSKNVQEWLTKYAAAARSHGCKLMISDVQSGIRLNGKRNSPIDPAALTDLSLSVREWAAQRVYRVHTPVNLA